MCALTGFFLGHNDDLLPGLLALRDVIQAEVASLTAPDIVVPVCYPQTFSTYTDFLLGNSEWDSFETVNDLESERPAWPQWIDVGGKNLVGAAYNGAINVPDDFVFSDALLDSIVQYLNTLPGTLEEREFSDYFALYPMRGNGSNDADPSTTAYGARGHKAVIHFKKDKLPVGNTAAYKNHMDDFEQTLVAQHGLPCASFYNYVDNDLACAPTDDEWLSAFYSDPDRIRRVVAAEDPNASFWSNKVAIAADDVDIELLR